MSLIKSQLYGVSESFSAGCGSLGGLVVGCSAFIRDLDTGARLGPHHTGELMVRSPTRMKGYLGRERDTQQFFTEEGFAHTGDLVQYDTQGNLYFQDRVKEMMKVKASWVGPGEIETCIELRPEVLESCVWVGSHHSPSHKMTSPQCISLQSTYSKDLCDDIIHAAVVIKSSFELIKDDIVSHVAEHLEAHKHITGEILFVNQIPHNPQGKKLRDWSN